MGKSVMNEDFNKNLLLPEIMEFIAPYFPESESEHEEEQQTQVNNNAGLYNLPNESDVLKRVNMDYQRHQAPEDMDIESDDFSNKFNDDDDNSDNHSFTMKREEQPSSSKKN